MASAKSYAFSYPLAVYISHLAKAMNESAHDVLRSVGKVEKAH